MASSSGRICDGGVCFGVPARAIAPRYRANQAQRPAGGLRSVAGIEIDRAAGAHGQRRDGKLRKKLSDLRPLSSLVALRALHLLSCGKLEDVRPLSTLTGLHTLQLMLYGYDERFLVHVEGRLSDVSPLTTLVGLQTLHLDYCYHLTDVKPLAVLTGLLRLSLDAWPRTERCAAANCACRCGVIEPAMQCPLE